jgi:hypothetical protein
MEKLLVFHFPLLGFPRAPPAGITASAQRAPRASPGPSRPSPSSSGLSSGTAPWRHAGGWRLVDGRPGGGEMRMGSVPGREGILSVPPRPSLRADSLFPHSPVPVRYDSRRPSPPQAQHPRPQQRVGPGSIPRAAGRPAVPEPCRPWGRRSLGWAACCT